MEKEGKLVRGGIPGIYHVKGDANLPFQIIITDELKGDEYAACRALTGTAVQADIERIIEGVGQEKDDATAGLLSVIVKAGKHRAKR